MNLFDRLDDYGTDHPGFREGHPEDRCGICSHAVDDHPAWWPDGKRNWRHPARWPHRRSAAVALAGEWWDRAVIRLLLKTRWLR